MFISKHVVFLEKEFLLKEDSGSEVELGVVQGAQIDTVQLPEPEADVHSDEKATGPSKTQAVRRSSRIHAVPERYGFLISEKNDVLLMEHDEPTIYEEVLNSSEYDRWIKAMKL